MGPRGGSLSYGRGTPVTVMSEVGRPDVESLGLLLLLMLSLLLLLLSLLIHLLLLLLLLLLLVSIVAPTFTITISNYECLSGEAADDGAGLTPSTLHPTPWASSRRSLLQDCFAGRGRAKRASKVGMAESLGPALVTPRVWVTQP